MLRHGCGKKGREDTQTARADVGTCGIATDRLQVSGVKWELGATVRTVHLGLLAELAFDPVFQQSRRFGVF